MSSNKEYILSKTYYNKLEIERVLVILSDNEIEYKINDKSNFSNFRVPQSTYIEVDLLIKVSDYKKAYYLLMSKI